MTLWTSISSWSGAGPVGLATALEGALAGLRVAVVERRVAPIDKACGEGLMPSARASLERLGVAVEGRPFRGIRYLAPGRRATRSSAGATASASGASPCRPPSVPAPTSSA